MAENSKQQLPRMPPNFPPFYPGLNPEQLKHLQANLQRSNAPLPPPPGAGFPNAPIMNPRLYQHFANNIRMMQMPPMWPYMPYNRPPMMSMPGKDEFENKPIPQQIPFPQPNQASRPIQIQDDKNGSRKIKSGRQWKKNQKADQIPEQRMQAMPIQPQVVPQPKTYQPKKQKQVRHASVKKYEPVGGKKKPKKQYIIPEVTSHRETRQKKQTIEKLMMMIMKDRPKRDRVMKIGKDYQAIVPESFINQYEYQLKIKMQKKKELMSRMIQPQVLSA